MSKPSRSIRIDDRLAAEHRISEVIPVDRRVSVEGATIGGSLGGGENGRFDLAELIVYDRMLDFRDRLGLVAYVFEKYFPEPGT